MTGASGGIGIEVAKELVSKGYAVVLHSHMHTAVTKNAAQSFRKDADFLLTECDLRDAVQTKKMIESIHAAFGSVALLVNCAGVALPQKLFTDTSDKEIEAVFAVNVTAMMRVTRMLIDDLRKKEGAVINISSMWGITGASCEVIYSASKAAVIGFTKALAKELAPTGVRVNAVAPGYIPTAMNAGITDDDTEAFRISTPLERLGTPHDIAEAVAYLADANFVTGQVLSVDGGIVI